MKNLKTLRRELTTWGHFWASKEYGVGYARRSSCSRVADQLRLGLKSKSDKHLFSHHAEMISVPDHIQEIDSKVGQLRTECVQVLRVRYVLGLDGYYGARRAGMERRTFEFWLQKAELGLV